jgi:prephenate dehydrogenase
MQVQRIAIVGYGEVGKIFAAGLRPQVAQLAAWDRARWQDYADRRLAVRAKE